MSRRKTNEIRDLMPPLLLACQHSVSMFTAQDKNKNKKGRRKIALKRKKKQIENKK